MAFAEDMSAFFNTDEFAVVGVRNGVSANVLLDMPTVDVLDERVSSNDYNVTFPASVWAGIARGEQITVDGVAYKVREIKLLDDGKIKQLLVSKV